MTPNVHDLFAVLVAVLSIGVAWGMIRTKIDHLQKESDTERALRAASDKDMSTNITAELRQLRHEVALLVREVAHMQGRIGIRPIAEPGKPPRGGSGTG